VRSASERPCGSSFFSNFFFCTKASIFYSCPSFVSFYNLLRCLFRRPFGHSPLLMRLLDERTTAEDSAMIYCGVSPSLMRMFDSACFSFSRYTIKFELPSLRISKRTGAAKVLMSFRRPGFLQPPLPCLPNCTLRSSSSSLVWMGSIMVAPFDLPSQFPLMACPNS